MKVVSIDCHEIADIGNASWCENTMRHINGNGITKRCVYIATTDTGLEGYGARLPRASCQCPPPPPPSRTTITNSHAHTHTKEEEVVVAAVVVVGGAGGRNRDRNRYLTVDCPATTARLRR